MSDYSISYQIGIDEYHSSPLLSTSKLSDFATRGARFFHAKHISRTTPEEPDSDAQLFGQLFEDLAQGRGFDDSLYVIKPADMKFNSTANKKWRDDHLAAGRRIVTEEDVRRMASMREALADNESALEMIRAAKAQATLRGPYAGTPGLQSRPDWLSEDGCLASGYVPFTLDLKTTRSLTKLSSGVSVREYRYHSQASLARVLMSGLLRSETRHYLLAVEKQLPFRAQVVEVPRPWLTAGWEWCAAQLARLARHYETNHWPRVDCEVVELPEMPAWMAADTHAYAEETDATG